MSYTDKDYQSYKAAATKYLTDCLGDKTSNHLIDIATSVMLHRDDKRKGGHFVTAICNNDLQEAIGRADNEMINYLKVLVMIKLNCIPDEW